MLAPILIVLVACAITALAIPAGIVLGSKLGFCPPLYVQIGKREFFFKAWRSRFETVLAAQFRSHSSFPGDQLPVASTAVAFAVLIVCVGTMDVAPARAAGLTGSVPNAFVFKIGSVPHARKLRVKRQPRPH